VNSEADTADGGGRGTLGRSRRACVDDDDDSGGSDEEGHVEGGRHEGELEVDWGGGSGMGGMSFS